MPTDGPRKKKEDDDTWEDDDEEESDNYDIFADNSKSQQAHSNPESSKQGEQRGDKKQCGEANEDVVVVMDTDEIVPQSAKDHSPDLAIDGSGSCMEVSTQEVEENGIVISKDEEVVVLETQEQPADRGGQKIAETIVVETHDRLEESQRKNQEQPAERGGQKIAEVTEVETQDKMEEFQHKKQKTKLKAQVAERACTRAAGTGTPIPVKAERRVAWADNQGTNHNSFAILQNIDNDVLASVAKEYVQYYVG